MNLRRARFAVPFVFAALPVIALPAACGSSGSGSADAGGGGGACAVLAGCCGGLPSAELSSCIATEATGSNAECEIALTTYCGSTSPGGSSSSSVATNACATLAACCTKVPEATMPSCLENASGGNAAVCEEDLGELTAYCGTATSSSSSVTAAPACAALAACCSKVPSVTVASCDVAAAAGNEAACETDLGELTAYCGSTLGSSSVGASTSIGGSTSTVGGSGTGSGAHTSTASTVQSTTVSGTTSCTNPPTTPPVGFVPPTGVIGAGCTTAETEGWGACEATPADFNTDAGYNKCVSYISVPDGNFNSCGQCVQGTAIEPGVAIPSEWGFDIVAAVYGELGDESSLYPVGWELNLGGCLVNAGGSSVRQCGLDVMAVSACELATCLPLCAVPEADANNPGAFNDLIACTAAADNGACASYVAAERSACASADLDAGVGEKCTALFDKLEPPDGGAPSTSGSVWAELIGLTCGGVDAGF